MPMSGKKMLRLYEQAGWQIWGNAVRTLKSAKTVGAKRYRNTRNCASDLNINC